MNISEVWGHIPAFKAVLLEDFLNTHETCQYFAAKFNIDKKIVARLVSRAFPDKSFKNPWRGVQTWRDIPLLPEVLREEYENTQATQYDLADKYHIEQTTISAILKNTGFEGKKVAKKVTNLLALPITDQELAKWYDLDWAPNEIAKYLKVSTCTISRRMKRIGHNTRTLSQALQQYEVNEHYFETIDTEEKAYWLGFLYADGCNEENRHAITLRLAPVDLATVEAFKKAIGSTHPIKRAQYGEGFENVFLFVNNKTMSRDLAKQGCGQAKSLTLKFPTTVPDHLMPHFLRGMFDGDGTVGKDKKNNYHFGIISTRAFLEPAQEIFMRNCDLAKTKLIADRKMWTLRYGGNQQVYRIYKYLYPTPDCVKMSRKYQRFQDMIGHMKAIGKFPEESAIDTQPINPDTAVI